MLFTRASSTTDFYYSLGEALAREAHWLGAVPQRRDLLDCIRSLEVWAEPGEVAADWLLTPPELVKGYKGTFTHSNPSKEEEEVKLRPKRRRKRKPWLT